MSTGTQGRPRSERTRSAILKAAFDTLAERGYPGMSIEMVADRAGAGKTTIYRWWRTKADLAVDAFFVATDAELRLTVTDDPAMDFSAQILELGKLLKGTRGVVFAAMLGGAQTDPELARALGDKWLAPRRKWGEIRMTQAIAEGKCHPEVDCQSALGLLYGPLYAPLLFGQHFPSLSQIRKHLTLVLPAIFCDNCP